MQGLFDIHFIVVIQFYYYETCCKNVTFSQWKQENADVRLAIQEALSMMVGHTLIFRGHF